MTMRWRYIVIAFLVCAAGLPHYVAAQEVSVRVTPHHQEHALSCEVATLKMALGVHGIDVSEDDLIARLPFDPTPRRPGMWGDPNQGFVGNIDGRMLVDGYGVYWQPIADVGTAYAQTEVLEHGSPQQLAQAISQGNPVIIWGYYGTQRAATSWQTPDGTAVTAISGEHTRLVYGFDGPVTSPTRFYLLDPSKGYMSWSTQELMHNWSSLQHMGVIVAPPTSWVRASGDTKIWELDTQRKIRRWITSWPAFVARGGTAAAVTTISREQLLKYTVGSPIT